MTIRPRLFAHIRALLLPILVLEALVLAGARPAAQELALTIQQLVSLDRLAEHAVSPDGSQVAYVVSSVDLVANRRRTDVWLSSLATPSQPRRLTDDPGNDTTPIWAPDGRSIFFLSSRSGSSQVWQLALEQKAPRQVTTLPLDVGTFALSPDGRLLAVALEVFADCDTVTCTADRLKGEEARQSTGRLFDRLFIRHWDTWSDGRRSHVFVVPVAGGTAVDVMKGIDGDTPSKPFGGAEEFTFSPDGRSIVFSTRLAGTTEAWSTNFDLYVAPVDGTMPPRNLTSSNPAWDTGPSFSPDGRTLAYLAMERAGFEADRFRIVLRDWPSGETRVLTRSWDRSPEGIVWSADSSTIYASAFNLGQKSLFAIDRAGGNVRTVIADGYVSNPRVAGDRLVVSIDTLRSPADLFTVRATDGTALTQITRANAHRLEKTAMGQVSQFTFTGWNDETVHAWLVKPINFDATRKYPLAFLIHGGPQSSFANNFHYRWNPQVYAGAGYGALLIDFHGSFGYGQAFTDAISGDWGGKPLVDLQKGLEAALAREPWIDGTRACALGASYGGYMVNWIAGNWPDRFRCLVSHDGNLDERMAYYATEELWFPEWEHGGTPWDQPEGYSKHNPIDHVGKWKTPMLVVHGGRDYRVVETQGMATFTALQRRGIPSRFLYFPDENHWVLKPQNSIQWHDTVLEWLARWTRP